MGRGAQQEDDRYCAADYPAMRDIIGECDMREITLK
jgi:hypothetical protein